MRRAEKKVTEAERTKHLNPTRVVDALIGDEEEGKKRKGKREEGGR